MNEIDFRVMLQIKAILMIIAKLMIHKMWYVDRLDSRGSSERLSELARDLDRI